MRLNPCITILKMKKLICSILGLLFLMPGIGAGLTAAEKTNVSSAVTTETAVRQPETVLPGDRISVRITEDATYGGIFSVSDNGVVTLPLINEITAAGLTPGALTKEIKEKLEKEYYKEATVQVSIYERNTHDLPYERTEGESGLTYSGGKSDVIGEVWVWGQVNRPGVVPVPRYRKLTVTRAIIACGGFSDFAKRDKVQVIRTDENGNQKTIVVNVAEIMKKGLLKNDLELKDGDVINVLQSFFNF